MPNTLPVKSRVLLDASVIIAGLLSPTGGSAKILQSCRDGRLQGFTSEAIKNEVLNNLPPGKPHLKTEFESDCDSGQLLLIQVLESQLPEFVGMVDEKDIHVAVAAKNAKADYLVSLNRRHLLGNKQAQSAIKAKIVSPKELIAIFGL